MSFLRKAADWVRSDLTRGNLRNDPVMIVIGTGESGRGGDFAINVVGEASYQTELIKVSGTPRRNGRLASFTKSADLVPEPNNPHDRNAVSVRIDGVTVGYLSRADAVQFHVVMEQLGHRDAGLSGLRAFVAGGDFYGVTLYTSHPVGNALGVPREHVEGKPPQERRPEPPVVNEDGVELLRVDIVGEGSCQDALQALVPAVKRDERASEWVSATLLCVDEGGVHVRVEGALVGWLEPPQARRFREFLSERGDVNQSLSGIVAEVRGGRRPDGKPALYGLALYMEPEIAERLLPKRRRR
jgi:hypothetical protein